MSVENAIWFPFWYELDQPITVGQISEFDFFKDPPPYILHEGLPVFYHGDWQEKCRHLYKREKKRILSIRHPQLGSIHAIDTKGLDYTFKLTDGRVLKVEAEETPGLIYDFPQKVDDWRVSVELEPVTVGVP